MPRSTSRVRSCCRNPGRYFLDETTNVYALAGLIALIGVTAVGLRVTQWITRDMRVVFLLVFVAAALVPVSSMTGGGRYLYLASVGFSLFVGVASLALARYRAVSAAVGLVFALSVLQLDYAARAWAWASTMTTNALTLMTSDLSPCGTRDVILLTAPVGIRGTYCNFLWEAFGLTSNCAPKTFRTLLRVVGNDVIVAVGRPEPGVVELRVRNYAGNILASSDLSTFEIWVEKGRTTTVATPLGRLDMRPDGEDEVFRLTLDTKLADARLYYYGDGERPQRPVNPGTTNGTNRPRRMSVAHRVREAVARRARTVPLMTSLWARYRRRKYERTVAEFLRARDGHAGRLPQGVVYEATMRCNLKCEFCYVGDLLNIEGEWREELPLETLKRAFPDQDGLQVSLTGGEIFMRKDILGVMDVFRDKGYVCGYLTTNGTIISEERADALAELAQRRLSEAHQRVDRRPRRAARQGARREGHVRADGRRPAPAAGGRAAQSTRRCASASTRRSRTRRSTRSTRWSTSPSELGVDAIGLNHLMFSTPEEVAETVRLTGAPRAVGDLDVRHAGSRRRRRRASRTQVEALAAKCRERGIRFDMRPKVRPAILDDYYTPGTPLDGRCLYPFLVRARVVQRQGLLLPVHPRRGRRPDDAVARGGLDGRALRRAAEDAASKKGLFPVCRRCCKVELSPAAARTRAGRARRPIRAAALGGELTLAMLGARTLLVNPPLVGGIAFTRQGRCQEREEVLGTTKPPYTLALAAALLRERGLRRAPRRSHGDAAVGGRPHRAARRRGLPADADRVSEHDADARRRRRRDGRAQGDATARRCSASARTPRARRDESMERAPDVDGMFVGEPEDGLAAAGRARLARSARRDPEPHVPPRRPDRAAPGARLVHRLPRPRRIRRGICSTSSQYRAAARQQAVRHRRERRAAARTRATSASRRSIRATSSARRARRRSSTRSSTATASSG